MVDGIWIWGDGRALVAELTHVVNSFGLVLNEGSDPSASRPCTVRVVMGVGIGCLSAVGVVGAQEEEETGTALILIDPPVDLEVSHSGPQCWQIADTKEPKALIEAEPTEAGNLARICVARYGHSIPRAGARLSDVASAVTMAICGRVGLFLRSLLASGIWVREVSTAEEYAEALAVRERVFVGEQRVPLDEELDGLDVLSRHLIVTVDGVTAATGRLVPPSSEDEPCHLGRIAVDAEYRSLGLGRRVVEGLESMICATETNASSIPVMLSAQVQALPFYERLGYVAEGPVYLDAGIEHRDAYKQLSI